MMMQKWMFFLVLPLFFACNSSQKSTAGDAAAGLTTKCKTAGIVRDLSGLDGCQFMIEIENGEKWRPAKIEDDKFQLRDGQAILFGYREVSDVVSTCMAETKTVEVTCIKEITNDKDKPIVKQCWDLTNPTDAPWMAELMEKHQPFRITKYNFRDGWAYLILSSKRRFFYTCQGKDLCPDAEEMEGCLNKYLKLMSNPQQIYSNQ